MSTCQKTSERDTLSHAIAQELREAILAGTYVPGMRIRQEELAERFGTSRIPVREALKDLESEGLVVLVPNSGAWIAKIDPRECDEIYKIRERVEPLALGESIRHMSDERIARLGELYEQIDATRDVDEFLRLDRDFHLESYADAQLPTLMAMIERFWNSTQHYRRAYSRLIGVDGQWIIHYEHRLLLEAIRRRDIYEAENQLRSHIRRTRLEFTQTPEDTA